MQLIGIAGPARAGKDTLCDYLTIAFEDQAYTAIRYAFADPMKLGLMAAFDLKYEEVHGDSKETPIPEYGNKSPRQMLQWFGTDFARDMVHQDIWLKVAARFMADYKHDGYDFMVIPDVRFNNEAQWIRNQGGVIIHVQRPECQKVHSHASENGILKLETDWTITNNADLEDLACKAVYFVDHYPNLKRSA